MKTIKIIMLFLCLLHARQISAQVYRAASPTNKVDGGQAYILPKAAFVVEVHIESSTIIRGRKLIDSYTDDELVILKEKYGVDQKKYAIAKGQPSKVEPGKSQTGKTLFSIVEDSLKIKVIARPDYSKIFYVDPQSKWYRNQVVTFNYSSDGILTEGESNNENKAFDIVVKGISALTSAAGAFYKDARNYDNTRTPDKTDIKELDEALQKFSSLENQLNYDIYKDLKKKLEKNYSDIFSTIFYKEKKQESIFKFIYTPSAREKLSIEIALFKLNDAGDIVFNQDLDIIAKKVIKADAAKDKDFYTIKIEALAEQQQDYYEERDVNKTGFAFNIAKAVNFKMTSPTDEVLYYEACKIPQFGIVGYTNTRKEKLVYTLDAMGELKKLSIEGKAITVDQVASLSSGLTEIITTTKGDSDATKLENEVKKLENLKKKRDLLLELEAAEAE